MTPCGPIRPVALLVACAVVSATLCVHAVAKTESSTIRVDTISHHVRLSLIVPKQTYPQNALVRVTVQVQNLSRHLMDLRATSGRFCPTTSPGIQVLNATGTVVYPPQVDSYSICTPKPSDAILRPGHVIERRLLVILRARYLQAVVTIGAGIESAIVPLTLVSGSPPPLAVSHGPSPHIDIARQAGDHGPLHYFQVTECRTANSDTVKGSLHWLTSRSRTNSSRLYPDCNPATSWHVTAGYVNQPVATVDYP